MCAHSHAWRGKILAPCILNTRSALSRIVFARHVKQGKYRGKNGGTRGGRVEHGNLKAILKPSSLFLLLPPSPFSPFPRWPYTGGRILIQPRWLTDKPDGFDGCEVFRSKLSTIQRKFALSLSLSLLGWPYSSPGRGISQEEMWWKLRIRYSTLARARKKCLAAGKVSQREYLRRSWRWLPWRIAFPGSFLGLRCSFPPPSPPPFLPINRRGSRRGWRGQTLGRWFIDDGNSFNVNIW